MPTPSAIAHPKAIYQFVGILVWAIAVNFGTPRAIATPVQPPGSKSICPTDLETLVAQMLTALPGYANRAMRRARPRTVDITTYVLVAGRPEFEPLPLSPGRSTSAPSSLEQIEGVPHRSQDPHQVFITTLERQYVGQQVIQLQHYHWLFLTQTEEGWRLAMMFSRLGPYPASQPATPPQDSSNGVIAQAIHTWLRDCRARDESQRR